MIAALFVVGSLRGVRTGAILAVDGNLLDKQGEMMETFKPRQAKVLSAIEAEIDIALKALEALHGES